MSVPSVSLLENPLDMAQKPLSYKILAVSWLSFGTSFMENQWSWRIPALGQAFPSIIQLAFIWCKYSPLVRVLENWRCGPSRILPVWRLGPHNNGRVAAPTL